MMDAIGPLPSCPVGKRGRHALAAIFSSEANHDLTLFCEWCGTVRRFPMTGDIGAPLDALDADAILRRIARGSP